MGNCRHVKEAHQSRQGTAASRSTGQEGSSPSSADSEKGAHQRGLQPSRFADRETSDRVIRLSLALYELHLLFACWKEKELGAWGSAHFAIALARDRRVSKRRLASLPLTSICALKYIRQTSIMADLRVAAINRTQREILWAQTSHQGHQMNSWNRGLSPRLPSTLLAIRSSITSCAIWSRS